MADPAYLLDSNICIGLLQGYDRNAAGRLQSCRLGEVVTSAIVEAEVMLGAAMRGGEAAADAFFDQIPVLPFDRACALAYSRVPFRRGNADRLIAAHALALGLVLVTNNERDFADIPGLQIENWTK